MLEHLTLYPDVPSDRVRQIVKDVLVFGLIALFVWIGVGVYHLVDALSVLGEGVSHAGDSIQGGFDSVGDAVSNVPVVGGALGDAFHSAGQGTGGNLSGLGQQGQDAVHLLARTIGIITAALPIAVLPRRVRVIREMSSARALTGIDLDDPERERLLAMRAAFGLPFRELLPYTSDPVGDRAEGRYDALVRAALADVGLRPKAVTR